MDKEAHGHYNEATDGIEPAEGEMIPSDWELARRALQGDPESVATLFDRYFDRVYDFCLRLLLDAQAAADAATETLRRSLTTLSDPAALESFKTHLFSDAVAVAVRRSMERERPLEEAQTEAFQQMDSERLSDPIRAPLAQEEAGLVWEGVLRLDPRDYALLDLHRRQDLDTTELATVLGISKQAAQRGLAKIQKDTESGISSLIMARHGSRSCEGMRRALLGLPIAATAEQLRRLTERHVRSCPVCAAARRALVPPFTVFGALAAMPASPTVHDSAQERVLAAWEAAPTLSTGATPAAAAPPPTVVARAAASGGGGGGARRLLVDTGALGEAWQRLISRRNPILPLGAALVVLAAAGGIAWGTGMLGGSRGGTAVASPTPEATSTGTPIPATPTASPTASVTPQPTVEASPTSEKKATPTPTATALPPTATPTATATADNITPTRTPRPTRTPEPTEIASPLPSETPESSETPSPTP